MIVRLLQICIIIGCAIFWNFVSFWWAEFPTTSARMGWKWLFNIVVRGSVLMFVKDLK